MTRLASDTPSLHFALAEPLSCALHALSKVQIIDDDEVLLVGCGGLGTCIAYALYANTIGVKLHLHDLVEPRVIGLVNCLPERFKKVGKLRKSYDVVLDASGTPQGLIAAIEHTKSGGKLVSLSHVDGRSGTDRLWDSIARKDLQLHFSYLNGEALNLTKAIELLKVHWNSNWNELVKIVPIDELESAMRYRNDSPFNKEICTIWSQL